MTDSGEVLSSRVSHHTGHPRSHAGRPLRTRRRSCISARAGRNGDTARMMSGKTYDVTVVGGGSAGCALTARLSAGGSRSAPRGGGSRSPGRAASAHAAFRHRASGPPAGPRGRGPGCVAGGGGQPCRSQGFDLEVGHRGDSGVPPRCFLAGPVSQLLRDGRTTQEPWSTRTETSMASPGAASPTPPSSQPLRRDFPT